MKKVYYEKYGKEFERILSEKTKKICYQCGKVFETTDKKATLCPKCSKRGVAVKILAWLISIGIVAPIMYGIFWLVIYHFPKHL
jgi:DNA-directed RNA polymerase subunit RPC12/RpoP